VDISADCVAGEARFPAQILVLGGGGLLLEVSRELAPDTELKIRFQPAQHLKAVEVTARIYYALGRRLRIHIAHTHANTLTTDTAWQDRARTDLAQELLSLQGELAGDVLSGGRAASTPEARVEAWIELRPEAFRRYEEVLDDLRNAPQVELAMLNVLAAKLRSLKTEVA